MMMMPPRPKNLYLVHGWEVGISERNLVMFEKGEDAHKLGLSLTISGNGQKFFVGRLLVTTEVTEGQESSWCSPPGPHDFEDLMTAAAELGMPQKEMPRLYVIAG